MPQNWKIKQKGTVRQTRTEQVFLKKDWFDARCSKNSRKELFEKKQCWVDNNRLRTVAIKPTTV